MVVASSAAVDKPESCTYSMEAFPAELMSALMTGDLNEKGKMYWKYKSRWEAALHSPELKAMQEAAAAAKTADAQAQEPRKRSRSLSSTVSYRDTEGMGAEQIRQLRKRIQRLKEKLSSAEAELHAKTAGKEGDASSSSAAPTFEQVQDGKANDTEG